MYLYVYFVYNIRSIHTHKIPLNKSYYPSTHQVRHGSRCEDVSSSVLSFFGNFKNQINLISFCLHDLKCHNIILLHVYCKMVYYGVWTNFFINRQPFKSIQNDVKTNILSIFSCFYFTFQLFPQERLFKDLLEDFFFCFRRKSGHH